MKKITLFLSLVSIMLWQSCEVTDFDFQNNPNELTQESVDPDFLLNEIQVLFTEFMANVSIGSDDVMRYESMSATYAEIASPSALNDAWRDLYALGINIKTLEELAASNTDLAFHRGISKILKAYSFTTMVDYVGDIPFSEALAPQDFSNPKADSGEAIYNNALNEIDAALVDLHNVKVIPATDLYYQGDASKWTKLANTLKLRLLINRRLIDATGSKTAINDLLDEGDLIHTAEDDFQFSYSSSPTPESRSLYYRRAYLSDGPTEYMGNYFLWLLKDSKSMRDPRIRYYIYRQTSEPPGDLLRCSDDGGATRFDEFDYCYLGDYYWGRDHGTTESVPQDRFLKSTYGLFPAGGTFDADQGISAKESVNLGGAGILPLLLSSYTDFLMAEAALTMGTHGDPKAYLENAIRSSMEKVLGFASIDSNYSATPSEVDAYVNEVMDEYEAAPTNEVKLDVVIREFYLSAFGNSIESYNAYRRTSFPSGIQEPIFNKNIPFPRSFPYPEDAVNSNSSLEVKSITTKVFWDNNPDGFIN